MERDTRVGLLLLAALALTGAAAVVLLLSMGLGTRGAAGGSAGEARDAFVVAPAARAGEELVLELRQPLHAGTVVTVEATEHGGHGREWISVPLDGAGVGRAEWRVPDWHVAVLRSGQEARTVVIAPR